MKHTPAHEMHNPDLLKLIPVGVKNMVEVGCSSGALAREYKILSPDCRYLGIEIDPDYAEMARRYCDQCIVANIENAGDDVWEAMSGADCWVFGDTLEHFTDPWGILRRVRLCISPFGKVVACIPNAQHWSVQARLSIGDFRYEESGLLDRTHLRWFTRQTIIELFESTGFRVEAGMPRIFNEPNRDHFLPMIESIARAAGGNAEQAKLDAMPLQFVVRASPK